MIQLMSVRHPGSFLHPLGGVNTPTLVQDARLHLLADNALTVQRGVECCFYSVYFCDSWSINTGNNNSPLSDIRGLLRPDLRPELHIPPIYQILENTVTSPNFTAWHVKRLQSGKFVVFCGKLLMDNRR